MEEKPDRTTPAAEPSPWYVVAPTSRIVTLQRGELVPGDPVHVTDLERDREAAAFHMEGLLDRGLVVERGT